MFPLSSIVNASLYSGNMAVDAIMNYTFVNDTLALAIHRVIATNTTLFNVLRELELLMDDELDANVTQVLKTAIAISADVQALKGKLMGMLDSNNNIIMCNYNSVR